MRKLLAFFLLFASTSYGQWNLPSKQSTVNTSSWTRLKPTNATVQSTFDYIDLVGVGGGSGGYGTNTLVNSNTWQYILQTPSVPTNSGVVSGFYLPGTNIVGATYSSNQWSINWTQILTQYPLLDVNYTDDASLTSTALVQGAVFRAYVPPGNYGTGITNTSSTNYFTNNVVVLDSANGWNSTNQTYTVPTDGYYLVGINHIAGLATNNTPWSIPNAGGSGVIIFDIRNNNSSIFSATRGWAGAEYDTGSFDGASPVFLTNGSVLAISVRRAGSNITGLTLNTGYEMNWFVSAIGGGGGGDEYDFYASYSPPTISPTNVIANYDFVVTNTMPINTGRLSTGIVVNVANGALVSPGSGYRFTPSSNKTYQLEFAYTWTSLENTDSGNPRPINATFLKNGESYVSSPASVNSPSLSYVGDNHYHTQPNYAGNLDAARGGTDFIKLTIVGNGTDYYDPVFLNSSPDYNYLGLIHNLTYSVKEID